MSKCTTTQPYYSNTNTARFARSCLGRLLIHTATVDAAFGRFASWYKTFGLDRRIGYGSSAARGVDIDYGLSSQPQRSLQWLNETIRKLNRSDEA